MFIPSSLVELTGVYYVLSFKPLLVCFGLDWRFWKTNFRRAPDLAILYSAICSLQFPLRMPTQNREMYVCGFDVWGDCKVCVWPQIIHHHIAGVSETPEGVSERWSGLLQIHCWKAVKESTNFIIWKVTLITKKHVNFSSAETLHMLRLWLCHFPISASESFCSSSECS